MPNVVVIGGGASGLMAAGTAAYYGANVTLQITVTKIHLLQMFLQTQDFYTVQLIILIAKIQ